MRNWMRDGGWRMVGLALLLVMGCGRDETVDADRDTPRRGEVTSSQRIVCGSPAVAEIVFALGCGDRVVGVSEYTVYPREAMDKEIIGGWINPNRERLLVVKPDIIITQGKHETLAAFAEEYGIAFHAVDLDGLSAISTAIASIAEVLGVSARGRELDAEIGRAIDVVSASVAGAPRKRVFLLFGRTHGGLNALGTVGPDTFLDDMIRVAGGINIFSDAKGAYPQVSKESLLVRQPEVILELNPGGLSEKAMALLRADWQEFPDIPAVRNDHIHCLTNDFLLIPGPRVGMVAKALADAIHPKGL